MSEEKDAKRMEDTSPTTKKSTFNDSAPKIQAVVRKPKTSSKFKEAIIGDGPNSVKTFLIEEILIPGLKTFVSTAANSITSGVNNSINKALFGGPGVMSPQDPNLAPWETRRYGYNNYYDQSYRMQYKRPANYPAPQRETRPLVESLGFTTYMAAKAALEQINDYITAYGSISVAQYYDICHVSTVFTQNNYGWTSTANMTISEYFDHEAGTQMYTIEMPAPVPLN